MNVRIPSQGAGDWRWLLARPGLHWKQGASAKSLADAWEETGDWPQAVAAAIATSPELSGLELRLALPEHTTDLPGGNRPTQTDLLVLAHSEGSGLAAIAVEGKATEPFGSETIGQWLAQGSAGRRRRFAHLRGALELPEDAPLGPIRYQLLHRTAAAVIEARRFGARHAVMLVHSFHADGASPGPNAWFEDFAAFAGLWDAPVAPGQVTAVVELAGVMLHLGWVADRPPVAEAQPGILTDRFDRAVGLARRLHARQTRKGTEIPYLAHLLGVASLVLEDGGSEDEAIAALLHDAVEDQGGETTRRLIEHEFGRHVAAIVKACSDTDVVPKPPWRERKEAYVAHLSDPELPAGTLRVSLSDKLHNARAIRFDQRAGADVFARFSAGRDEVRWYYTALADAFARLNPGPMVTALRDVITDTYEA